MTLQALGKTSLVRFTVGNQRMEKMQLTYGKNPLINSFSCRRMEDIIQEGSQPDPGVTPLKFDTVYARSLLQQYRICLWKFNITYWRTPNYNATRFSFSIAVALIFGACFWKLGGKTGNEQQVGTPTPSTCRIARLASTFFVFIL